jgi:ubiquinone/menaquinone biosynthesis C-methylase UbiE
MRKTSRNPIFRALKVFFDLLYHSFAWTYDGVAAVVSLGRWKGWVYSVIPFLNGPRILELGYGPGHLQLQLLARHLDVYGLDESPQMGQQARHRLAAASFSPHLARGKAEALPYPSGQFNDVVATFPSEYIARPETLAEIYRVLQPDGRLVVLLAAWITGKSTRERIAAWLFRITGQVPTSDAVFEKALEQLAAAHFAAELNWTEVDSSRLLVITAIKTKSIR